MSGYKKPESVEAIAARLEALGFPNEIYLGRTTGQWPIQAFAQESQVAHWLLDKSETRSRYAIKVDISKGLVTQVRAVEKIIERHLEVVA